MSEARDATARGMAIARLECSPGMAAIVWGRMPDATRVEALIEDLPMFSARIGPMPDGRPPEVRARIDAALVEDARGYGVRRHRHPAAGHPRDGRGTRQTPPAV